MMYFVALFLSIAAASFGLPSDVRICKFDDDECLVASANHVLRSYFKGHPDMALDSIDPLNIDSMDVQQNSGAIDLFVRLFDFSIAGFSKAKIYKISGFDSDVLDIRMKMPAATLLGPYDVRGKILILPVNGSGKLRLHFKNFDINLKLPIVKEVKDGKTFMRIENPKMSFDLTGGDVNFSHLGLLANGFLNSNFNSIINVLKPGISKSLSEKLADKINSVFATVPYEELFTS